MIMSDPREHPACTSSVLFNSWYPSLLLVRSRVKPIPMHISRTTLPKMGPFLGLSSPLDVWTLGGHIRKNALRFGS